MKKKNIMEKHDTVSKVKDHSMERKHEFHGIVDPEEKMMLILRIVCVASACVYIAFILFSIVML